MFYVLVSRDFRKSGPARILRPGRQHGLCFMIISAIVVKGMLAALIFSLFVLGFSGIVAQTVLIRESLIIYGGNELSIGMIIGSWVIWEALGAYAGGRMPRNGAAVLKALIAANLLFILFFPATVAAIRTFKIAMGMPPEMSLSIVSILASSLAVFMPCALIHGFSFTASCRIYEHIKTSGGTSAARSYFFEMAGTIIGGLAVSYVLVTRLHSMRIACIVFGIMSIACFILGMIGIERARPRNTAAAASLVFAIAAILCMAFRFDSVIETRSISAEWHDRNIVWYENSLYQNIVITNEQEQYTFFADGIPTGTLPTPDITRVEEIVHIPGLIHGSPRDVLIIHGGPGGVISEMLKYPTVQRIDYVEADPAYLRAVQYVPSGLVWSELNDKRVRVHYTDGRRFVKEAPGRYDIILSGIAAPRTLQANRFFTSEFFREIRGILKADGIFVFTLPGSLAYYDRELRDINASILLAAGRIFSSITVIPGEENIFLASSSKTALDPAVPIMAKRLKVLAASTRLISVPHLTYRLDREKAEWFRSTIKASRAKANDDLAPAGLFYTIAFDNALHDPSLKSVFAGLEKYGPAFFLVLSAGLAAAGFALRKRHGSVPVLFVTLTTGFSVMVLELLLIFVYQAWSGYVFHEIGMLITMLMTGMAGGALSAGVFSKRFLTPARALMCAETVLAAVCLVVPAIFLVPGIVEKLDQVSLRFLFFALLFVSGFFAGIEFPVAVEVYGKMRPGRTAVGPVYGIDLLGGFVGGIAGGFFLFPLMGLTKTCIFLFAVKVCGILILLTPRKK